MSGRPTNWFDSSCRVLHVKNDKFVLVQSNVIFMETNLLVVKPNMSSRSEMRLESASSGFLSILVAFTPCKNSLYSVNCLLFSKSTPNFSTAPLPLVFLLLYLWQIYRRFRQKKKINFHTFKPPFCND